MEVHLYIVHGESERHFELMLLLLEGLAHVLGGSDSVRATEQGLLGLKHGIIRGG